MSYVDDVITSHIPEENRGARDGEGLKRACVRENARRARKGHSRQVGGEGGREDQMKKRGKDGSEAFLIDCLNGFVLGRLRPSGLALIIAY